MPRPSALVGTHHRARIVDPSDGHALCTTRLHARSVSLRKPDRVIPVFFIALDPSLAFSLFGNRGLSFRREVSVAVISATMSLLPFSSQLIADVGISLGDEGKGRLIPEVADELRGTRAPVSVVLKVNGREWTSKAPTPGAGLPFTVDLPAGNLDLWTELAGAGEVRGAYYVDVRRIG